MKKQIEFYENKLAYQMDPSDLWDALENEESVVALDTRKAFGFEKEHIPTAINLPHREMNTENTAHLDPSKTYVCYCDGIGCNASTKGALQMAKLGFKVKELVGGLEWWKFDGYATEGTAPTGGSIMSCAC
ncbi:rhodanese-like domain-containing protein [Maribacter sp. 2-571]|uniref:rhodanese-like domain-containing protein n=1 Tax=Maribacter sp. 2-571 TaxID=3417569 RepID=UPI003D33B8CB